MPKWKTGLVVTATALLAAGCTGTIGDSNSSGSGSKTGSPSGTGGGGPSASGSGGSKGAGSGGTSGSPSASGGTSGGTTDPAACNPGVPATSQVRRLTNAQYERAVYDLLGVSTLTGANNV